MIEGSGSGVGSGSIPLTNGSGSGGPKTCGSGGSGGSGFGSATLVIWSMGFSQITSSSGVFASLSAPPLVIWLGLRLFTSLAAMVSTHMGHTTPSSTSFSSSDLVKKISLKQS